jgi:hypothetical protein
MPHILYVGDDALLDFTHAVKANLTFSWQSSRPATEVVDFLKGLTWEYQSQGVAKTIPAVVRPNGKRVQLALPDSIDSISIQGIGLDQPVASRWLQATLAVPFPDAVVAGDLRLSQVGLSVSNADSFAPDLAFNGNAPLDFTKEFYPFGQSPAVGSTFYIASQDAFSKPDSEVTLNIGIRQADAVELIWEYWDYGSNNWMQLPQSSAQDGTNGFTKSGTISLLVPANVPPGGQTGGIASWSTVFVRARLVSGSYRGAPSIKLNLKTAGSLSVAAKTGDIVIQTDFANLVAPGQVISIGGEYTLVVNTDGQKLTVSPALAAVHPAGTAVQLNLTTPVATLAQASNAGDIQINATVSGPVNVNSVLLVDDNNGPEFLLVKSVGQAADNTGAILPGVMRITTASKLLLSHAKGTSLAAAESMQVQGLGNSEWLDLTGEIFPFGKDPGPGDLFYLYTFGGFFASVQPVATAVTTAVSTGVTTGTFSPAATGLAGTTALSTAATTPGSTAVFVLKDNRVQATLVNQTVKEGGIRIGGIGFFTNPFVFGPQLRLNIDVSVKLNLPPVVVQWEFLGAEGWQTLEPTDNTNNFLADGINTVALPLGSCVIGEVNNKKNYWLRARIVQGNYGFPVNYVAVDPSDPSKGYQVQQGTGNLHPPIVTSLTIDYTASIETPALITRNGFLFAGQDLAGASGFAPFVSVTDLQPIRYCDPEPAFYVGFDAAFPQQTAKLYFDDTPRAFSGSVRRESSVAPSLFGALPQLKWEYFNGTAWSALTVIDGTNDLTESGTLEFLTPVDMKPLARFDSNQLYWVRARSSRNDPFDTQLLSGVYLNTTLCTQQVTVAGETVGSSNGQSGQTFTLARSPVLPGQQILVREPEPPTGLEGSVLASEEGSDAIQQKFNPTTQQTETWVRWHEVANFLASDPHSRHYTMDHSSGAVGFGDGQLGLIPPIGIQNIVADYAGGGGASGNLAAGVIAQIKSSLPGVASVTNPTAADGGSDTETIAMIEERGPQVIRHRRHSVSSGDLEWLARQAAGTRVARARCLSNVNRELVFEPGWATLIIVPQSAEVKPAPGSELLRDVENYLAERAFAGLTQQTLLHLNVIGPGFIRVAVAAKVVPKNIDEAQTVKQRVLDALSTFLHPLKGGTQGTGWEFGQAVYASKVSRLIENIDGVDHLESLQLIPNLAQHRLDFSPSGAGELLTSESVLSTPDGKKSVILAEPADTSAGRALVRGFKEGDRITRVVDLRVTSVNGLELGVAELDNSAYTSDGLGMPKGSVLTTFDGSQSTRLTRGILPNHATPAIGIQTRIQVNPGDVITLFYPFPMNLVSVVAETTQLTVTSAVGATIGVVPFMTDIDLPVGTLVTTADRTQRSSLAAAIPGSAEQPSPVAQITVSDPEFAAGLGLGEAISLLLPSQIFRIEPYEPALPLEAGGVLATLDNRIRLPLLAGIAPGQAVSSIRVNDFASGDRINKPASNDPAGSPEFVVETVEPVYDVVDIDDNFLLYSGPHQVTLVED